MRGVDFSDGRPGGAALKAAGMGFAMRYTPYAGDPAKGLSRAEIADYHANGLAVGQVFESTAQRPLDGKQAGHEDGRTVAMACEGLGWPADRPIYFACDWDVSAAQFATVGAYFDGVKQALGDVLRVGAYGHDRLLEYLRTTGRAAWFWQTTAWSGGRLYSYRHLFQLFPGGTINGAAVDYNDAFGDDQGLWAPEEDDMADPRVDEILKALTGQTDGDAQLKRLGDWNINGNSLLDGYSQEQAKLAAHLESHEKPQSGGHSHTPDEIPHGHGDAQ